MSHTSYIGFVDHSGGFLWSLQKSRKVDEVINFAREPRNECFNRLRNHLSPQKETIILIDVAHETLSVTQGIVDQLNNETCVKAVIYLSEVDSHASKLFKTTPVLDIKHFPEYSQDGEAELTICSPKVEEGRVHDALKNIFPKLACLNGDPGDASRLAQLVRFMSAIECLAISEAFLACTRLGISRKVLWEVLCHGAAKSDVLQSTRMRPLEANLYPKLQELDQWRTNLNAFEHQRERLRSLAFLPEAAYATSCALKRALEADSHEQASTKPARFSAITQQDGRLEVIECRDKPETDQDVSFEPHPTFLVLGLGMMGIGIATCLQKKFKVYGYDVDKRRCETYSDKRGKICTDVRGACDQANYIICTVGDEEQIDKLFFDQDSGIADALESETTILIHTTVSPTYTKKLQNILSKHCPNVQVLDAPMSGSPAKAEVGELLVVLGGEQDRVKSYLPFLKHYTSTILVVGELGVAGHLKLLHNSIGGLNLIVSAFVIQLGIALGFHPQFLYNFIRRTEVRNTYFEDRVPQMLSTTDKVSATLGIWIKDLSLVTQEYMTTAYFSPLLAYTLVMFRKAAKRGSEHDADALVSRVWHELNGSEVGEWKSRGIGHGFYDHDNS